MKRVIDNAYVRVLLLALVTGAILAVMNPLDDPTSVAFGYALGGLPLAWIGLALVRTKDRDAKRATGYAVYLMATAMMLTSMLA